MIPHTNAVALVLCAVFAVAGLLVGCNTQSPTFSSILVPLPPASSKSRPPARHPPPPKPVVLEVVVEQVQRPPEVDWNAIYAELPRDNKGTVDWMRALTEQTIKPKPGIDPEAPEANTTDDEVVLTPTGNPSKYVTFRHATHTQWMSCKNCHPAIFKKKADNVQFTHDDMDAGKYCGACHGKVVVVPGGCYGCHVKKKAA